MTFGAKPEGRTSIRVWIALLALLPATAGQADEGTSPRRAVALEPAASRTGAAGPARSVHGPQHSSAPSGPASVPNQGGRVTGRPASVTWALNDWMTSQGMGTEADFSSPRFAPEAMPAPVVAPAASVVAPPASSTASVVAPGPTGARGAGPVEALPQASAPVQPGVAFSETQASWDDQVAQAACATCGGFHGLHDGSALHESLGCGGGQCIPGRKPCYPPANSCNTIIGTFCQNLYQCLCCPDPCYQPQWVPAANASFFADYARPRTVTRLRYDNLEDMTRPDRNQFWIRGVVPTRNNNHRIRNPYARLQQFYVYQEAAGKFGSFFVEYPYRQINQSWAPTQAGFGNVNFGIKSLMFDCELLQVAFQFRTFMPSGNASLNLGNGLFAVDPSILTALKLGPETYFQGQFGNWIPLGGNSKLAGGVFYSLMSLNHVVARPMPDCPLIATLEMDVWSFENGGYTAAIARGQKPVYVQKGGGVSYFNIGPGLRQSICNRLDVGAAITWATNTAHWAQPWFRFEARFLF